MDVGKKIRELREERHLNQGELARRSGIARNTVNRIENGHEAPTARVLVRIARALGVEPGALFEEPALPLGEAPRGAGRPELTEKARMAQEWAWQKEAQLHGMSDEEWSTYVRGLDTEDEIVQAYQRLLFDEKKMLHTAWHMDKAFRPERRAWRRELSQGLRELRAYRLYALYTAALRKQAEELADEISSAQKAEAVG